MAHNDDYWLERISGMEGWTFGSDAVVADQLARLVCDGVKTATSSLYEAYQDENDPLPKAGDVDYVKDSKGRPVCVVEFTHIEVLPFLEVPEVHAIAEGEGDLSLESWRDVHRTFFKKFYPDFHDGMRVVCESFKVVHVFKEP